MRQVKLGIIGVLACFLSFPLFAIDKKTDTVILVTIDGVRWQDVFRGLDPKLASEDLQKKFLNRESIMPFLWGKVAKSGALYGNRDEGSHVNLVNPYHYSYPGYNEMLTGSFDPVIVNNDKTYNENVTVLEKVNQRPKHIGRVAAYATWPTFTYIVNDKRSSIPVSVDNDRTDAQTYTLAMKQLQAKKMSLVYIAFDEADTAAHNASYDDYITAVHRADTMIAELWQELQADQRYKGNVSLVITTDHGRGDKDIETFSKHGGDVTGDEHVWFATLSPDDSFKPNKSQPHTIGIIHDMIWNAFK